MQIEKLEVYSFGRRHLKETKMSENTFPSSFYPQKSDNIQVFKRPLKYNSNDLSFKGLFFDGSSKNKNDKKQVNPAMILLGSIAAIGLGLRFAPRKYRFKKAFDKPFSQKEFLEFTDKYLGNNVGEKLLEHLKSSEIVKKNKLLVIDGDNITLYKKRVPQLIWDGLKYPFTILPADILNGIVKLSGKIKPFKNLSDKLLKHDIFRNIRQRSKIDSELNSLQGLVETQLELKGKPETEIVSKMFQRSVKMFDTEKGAYDSKHERALNRIVSGIPPAVFLANDAYNLSRMMDDDSKKADKEQKTRFRQEVTRIVTNAYLTLITFGALNKYINNSKLGTVLLIFLTTLFTESVSRVTNGKHLYRISPEKARKENLKNDAPEKDIKPDTSFKANDSKQKDDNKVQKPLLSASVLGKASLAVILGGFGLKGLRKINGVDSFIKSFQKPFKDFYKKITTESDHTVKKMSADTTKPSEISLDRIAELLNEKDIQGFSFEDLAKSYETIAKELLDEHNLVHLGETDKKINILGAKVKIKPFVNFVIAPFKFALNAVTLPYRLTDKLIKAFSKKKDIVSIPKDGNAVISITKKSFVKNNPELEIELDKFIGDVRAGKILKSDLTSVQKEFLRRVSDVSAFSKSVDAISKKAVKLNIEQSKFAQGKISQKQMNAARKEFDDYIRDNISKAFNTTTLSNVSNAELSNLAKTSATAATLWFLMTDNYNMVMLKSNGNDVDGAKTKFKERFVQEISRLFYQTLLIDLFNSTFRSQYNASLLGMSCITVTNTTLGEMLTRKSVGMPLMAHTRDELENMEEIEEEDDEINSEENENKEDVNFGKQKDIFFSMKDLNNFADQFEEEDNNEDINKINKTKSAPNKLTLSSSRNKNITSEEEEENDENNSLYSEEQQIEAEIDSEEEIKYNKFFDKPENKYKKNAQREDDISNTDIDENEIFSQIKKIEEKMISNKKDWPTKGEILAKERPKDSLLTKSMDFEVGLRAPPIPDKEFTDKLEKMIKQRIIDDIFEIGRAHV